MSDEIWFGRYSVIGAGPGGGIARVWKGGESPFVFENEHGASTKGHRVTAIEARTESTVNWSALTVLRTNRPDGTQELKFSNGTIWVKIDN